MQRRDFLRTTAGVVGGMAVAGRTTASAAQEIGGLRFLVFRNDREIGHHTLSFAQDGDRLTVSIDIELAVRFAFITAYRYEHTNREEWAGGRLVGFASRTNDNGERHAVRAVRDAEQIVIESSGGRASGPGTLLPATYWHRNFVAPGVWINTQTGRIVEAAVSPLGTEQIVAEGNSIAAERFQLTGDVDMDLWYAQERWVKLAFDGPDGSRIDYRMVDSSAYRQLTYRPGEPGPA